MMKIKVHILYGHLELKPVEYRLGKSNEGFWIESDFGKLGPFDTKDEAHEMAISGGIRIRRQP